MSSFKVAIIGFRHGHIFDILRRVQSHPELTLTATCEEDAETRRRLTQEGKVAITHASAMQLLDEAECDIVAVGDYYSRRGSILIEALRRGKHVIGDKPLCVTLKELDEIARLARAGKRVVGCMLDLRDAPVYIGLRQAVQEGRIGTVTAVGFTGQHPLALGTRPEWYFEEGKQGGTLNDIAVHAVDAIPWITGEPLARIESARTWNAGLPQFPFFNNGAQMMLSLRNGAGVLGDVSYFAPDQMRCPLPTYWRITIWGTAGVLEANLASPAIIRYAQGFTEPETIPLPPARPGGYLEDFVREIRGEQPDPNGLTTETVLTVARNSLMIQEAADQGLTRVNLTVTEP
jgi:predicted dehydrogenase